MMTFQVSFTGFAIRDGHAEAASGDRKIGLLTAIELIQVLSIFHDINPIQQFDTEPVIHISTRHGGKFIVRTDMHRLILYDLHHPEESALVLDANGILHEIDDDLRRSRQHLTHRLNQADKLVAVPSFNPHHRALLQLAGSALICLLALSICLAFPAPTEPEKAKLPQITDTASLQRLRDTISGTYCTGKRRGDYAVTLLPSGELRLVQVGDDLPQMLRYRYELSQVDGQLFLLIPDAPPAHIEKDHLRLGKLVLKKL